MILKYLYQNNLQGNSLLSEKVMFDYSRLKQCLSDFSPQKR